MTPEQFKELIDGIVKFVLQLLPTLLAFIVIVPPIFKRQMTINLAKQEEQLRLERQARVDAQKKSDDDRNLFRTLVESTIKDRDTSNRQSDDLVRAYIRAVDLIDKMSGKIESMGNELHANTQETTSTAQALGDLSENINALATRLDLRLAGIETNNLALGVENRIELEKILVSAKEMSTHAQILERLAEAKIEDVKKLTGEMPVAEITPT